MRAIRPAALRSLRQGFRPSSRSFATAARLSQAQSSRVIDRLIGKDGLLMGTGVPRTKSAKGPQRGDRSKKIQENQVSKSQPEVQNEKPQEKLVAEPQPQDHKQNFPQQKKAKNPSENPTPLNRQKGIRFSEGSIRVELPFKPDQNLTHFQLRDMCKCPECVDPHSKQRSFRTQDIPSDIRASDIKFDGNFLEVSWKNDIPGYGKDHISRWDLEYFKDRVIDPHLRHSRREWAMLWDRTSMTEHQHWISYNHYIKSDKRFAAAILHLRRTGLIFVKDIPQSREMVEKIATRMGPLRNSFYGSTWDVRSVPEAKNVAYTNQFLGFHMDLLYMNEPPGYQLLHCLENSCVGGESLFVDTAMVAHRMKKELPDMFNLLTQHKLAYEYRHENAIYYNQRPVIEKSTRDGEIHRVNYSPPFQSALPDPDQQGDLSSRPYQKFTKALKTLSDRMETETNIFQLKLNPGECVIFDNRRIAHARRQFDTATGSRWLAGAYVDEDAVLSQMAVSYRKYPPKSSTRTKKSPKTPALVDKEQAKEETGSDQVAGEV